MSCGVYSLVLLLLLLLLVLLLLQQESLCLIARVAIAVACKEGLNYNVGTT